MCAYILKAQWQGIYNKFHARNNHLKSLIMGKQQYIHFRLSQNTRLCKDCESWANNVQKNAVYILSPFLDYIAQNTPNLPAQLLLTSYPFGNFS